MSTGVLSVEGRECVYICLQRLFNGSGLLNMFPIFESFHVKVLHFNIQKQKLCSRAQR